MPRNVPFTANEAKLVNEMMSINNDVLALYKQKQQFEFALAEVRKLIKDTRAGVIKDVGLMKGNMLMVPIRNKKDILNIFVERRKTLETSLKGIEGQLAHRQDYFVEAMVKVVRQLGGRISDVYIPQKGDGKTFDIPSSEDAKVAEVVKNG